ncbi:MAG: hypothetical protein IJO45_01555 [Oscillospiraceae bacterium]|nr:hypothetical protein [Oscillospiraceae bacterium]
MSHTDEHPHLTEHLPHIGLRKMKSLLAIFVGFWVWQLIRLVFPSLEVHPLYIYIYGVIEMRDSSQKTVDMGKDRIKATFVAMGVGLPLLFLGRWLTGMAEPSWFAIGIDLALLLLGTLFTLILAEKANCHAYCGLCAAIFIIFMLTQKDGEPVYYSVFRASQTLIGVFIAWLINVKLFPYEPQETTETEPEEDNTSN